jgi:hypothetical protein
MQMSGVTRRLQEHEEEVELTIIETWNTCMVIYNSKNSLKIRLKQLLSQIQKLSWGRICLSRTPQLEFDYRIHSRPQATNFNSLGGQINLQAWMKENIQLYIHCT